jgi:structural maintenance of chromosomes protein 5
MDRGRAKKLEMDKIKKDLENLNSREGQLENWLGKNAPEALQGWSWLQEHKDDFEKEVFGPPLLNCSLNDMRYSDLIQSLLQKEDFLCFVAQTTNDHKKLSEQFYSKMGLGVGIRTILKPLSEYKSPLSREHLSAFGLDSFAIDLIDGPSPVLAMLCAEKKLHLSGVALSDITDSQYERLVSGETVNSWAAGGHSYRITRRREYGPGAVSTTTRNVQKGPFWKAVSVDLDEKRKLARDLVEAQGDFDELKQQSALVKAELQGFTEREKNINEEIVCSTV